MTRTPDVTVVIPTLNGLPVLKACLASLRRQAQPFRLIVVDNGSTDGTGTWLSSEWPEAVQIHFDRNLGFSAAVNAGIRTSDTPFVLLLNNDTVAEPDFLERLTDSMATAPPDVAAVNPLVMLLDGRVDNIGIRLDREWQAWQIGWEAAPGTLPGTVVEIFGVNACATLYRKAFFDDAGFFDEAFFAYYEDVDLAIRGRRMGWRFLHEPAARILHHHSYTTGKQSDVKIRLSRRNALLTLIQNGPFLDCLYVIGYRKVLRDLGLIPHYLKSAAGRSELRMKIGIYAGVLQRLPGALLKRFRNGRRFRRSLKEWYGRSFAP